MEFRWYTTYNKYGVDSPTVLQARDSKESEWEDVYHVREQEREQKEESNA